MEDDDGFTMVITRGSREKMRRNCGKHLNNSDRMTKNEVEKYFRRVTEEGYDIAYDMPLEHRFVMITAIGMVTQRDRA